MLIVIKAIANAVTVVITNTAQLILIRYAKSCSHLFITHQATGDAIKMATATSLIKSFDNSVIMLVTLAPNTLRTPISLVLCSALKVASPNNPRHEMKIAMKVNTLTIDASLFSAS